MSDATVLDLHDVDGGAQLGVVVPALGGLVSRVAPGDMGLSTPCASWTTRDLLNHVVGGAVMFTDAFGGAPLRDISGRMPDVVADAPMPAFEAAAGGFGAATQQPGAMDQLFALPWGTMTGRTLLRFVAFDLLMHSWDLATTLGTEVEVPEELVVEIEAFAHLVLDPWDRDDVNFTAPLPAATDAAPLERLVAYSGRKVA